MSDCEKSDTMCHQNKKTLRAFQGLNWLLRCPSVSQCCDGGLGCVVCTHVEGEGRWTRDRMLSYKSTSSPASPAVLVYMSLPADSLSVVM